MARGLFKKLNTTTAVVADAGAREAFRAIKEGATFVAEISHPKNQEQVNLFFALRDLVCEATDSAREPAKEWLLEQTGFVDLIFYPDGTMRVRPKSIASMSNVAFDDFFQKAITLIQRELEIKDRKDLLRHYFDLLDPATRAAARQRLKVKASPPTVPADPAASTRTDERELEKVGRGS